MSQKLRVTLFTLAGLVTLVGLRELVPFVWFTLIRRPPKQLEPVVLDDEPTDDNDHEDDDDVFVP